MSAKIKPDHLPEFRSMYKHCFGVWSKNHEEAAKFFGVSVQTCRRWYTGEPHPLAHRLLTIHYKGYLPFTAAWRHAYIDKDGNVNTPHGSCRPSDLAFVHRYKWAAEQNAKQVQQLRDKLKEYQEGTTLKMIQHTTDYLNRLVKEYTGQ